MIASALYPGVVTHHRRQPVAHALRYRIFLLALDLDEAATLGRRFFLFGFDRWAPLGFFQRDHGDGARGGLRAWLDAQLAAAGMPTGGAVRVLCMPRVLGHAFNPLTVFFCHAPDGDLQALLYQVNNTFGQRHSYLLPVVPGRGRDAGAMVRQHCMKTFHVSPFMAMDLRYRFRVTPPGERVGVFITASDQAGVVLTASFTGRRQPLNDMNMLRAILRMPLMGAKVLLGIHWEALKLWRRGLALRPRPALPTGSVTIGS